MSGINFTATITVDQAPEQAFAAINNVRGWWSGDPGVEGRTDRLGAEFTYRYKDLHYSKQRIIELVPARRVVWLVIDSDLSFVKDRSEWNGTTITFDIARDGDKTEVRFTHVGLVPDFECYGDCSSAWGYYVRGPLRKLIAKGGTRTPKRREQKGGATSRARRRRPRSK